MGAYQGHWDRASREGERLKPVSQETYRRTESPMVADRGVSAEVGQMPAFSLAAPHRLRAHFLSSRYLARLGRR